MALKFVEVKKFKEFKGAFKLNGQQFEFSEVVFLKSTSLGEVKGQLYRYPASPDKIYFVTVNGENIDDVTEVSVDEKPE